jgi:hypothetical protein
MSITSNYTNKTDRSRRFTITRRHILLAACALIIAGYILMAGPGSTEQSFNPDIFSTRRITVAPIMCLAGYLLIGIGILYRK